MQFFDMKNHFNDGLVSIEAGDHVAFEAVFRFLRNVDPTISKDKKLVVANDNTPSVSSATGTNEESAYIFIHRLSADRKEDVAESIKKENFTAIEPLAKYLEAMHYDASVVSKENVTHVFFFQRISSSPTIYIKLAFSLRLLCPTLFEGERVFCDEFKKVMSYIDKDNYNEAWNVLDPYFAAIRQEQWQKELKNMFISSYGEQIKGLKRQVDNAYSSINELSAQMSKYYKNIEDLEIKIRGMLSGSGNEDQYEQFIQYLNDTNGEIIDYEAGKMTVRFTGFLDDYDPQVAEDIIPSTDGYLYGNIRNENKEAMKTVMTKVFLENKYKIRVVSSTVIDQREYSIHCKEYFNRPNSKVWNYKDKCYLYNPHLWHHDCYGNDRRCDMYEAMKSYDYYSLAMFVHAANSNISFSDSTVIEEFGEDIIRHREDKIFYCPEDGNDYSFDGILIREKGVES